MKSNRLLSVMAAGLVVASASAALAECRDNRVNLRDSDGQFGFTVDLADTPAERAQGLMHVPSMPRFSGMLFVFEAPQRAVFWMENTLIPLDMLFIDAQGVVQHIHENAIPMDRTGIDGGQGIQYVLEINGGMSEMLGIEVGAELRHPALNQQIAAWPCEQGPPNS